MCLGLDMFAFCVARFSSRKKHRTYSTNTSFESQIICSPQRVLRLLLPMVQCNEGECSGKDRKYSKFFASININIPQIYDMTRDVCPRKT